MVAHKPIGPLSVLDQPIRVIGPSNPVPWKTTFNILFVLFCLSLEPTHFLVSDIDSSILPGHLLFLHMESSLPSFGFPLSRNTYRLLFSRNLAQAVPHIHPLPLCSMSPCLLTCTPSARPETLVYYKKQLHNKFSCSLGIFIRSFFF